MFLRSCAKRHGASTQSASVCKIYYALVSTWDGITHQIKLFWKFVCGETCFGGKKVVSLFENAVERVHGGWRMLTEQTFTLDLRHWDVADVRKEHFTSFSPARLARTRLWGTEISAGHDERSRVVLCFALLLFKQTAPEKPTGPFGINEGGGCVSIG